MPFPSVCWYCDDDGESVPATHIAHDSRECLPVCAGHARWRSTTSMGIGHKKCPQGHPDGPQRDGRFVQITPI